MTIIWCGTCDKTGMEAVFVQKFEQFLKRINGWNGCLPPALLPIAGFHVTSATKILYYMLCIYQPRWLAVSLSSESQRIDWNPAIIFYTSAAGLAWNWVSEKWKHSGGVENNTRYCFIALFQSFMFCLLMKMLSSKLLYYKYITQQSRHLSGWYLVTCCRVHVLGDSERKNNFAYQFCCTLVSLYTLHVVKLTRSVLLSFKRNQKKHEKIIF